MRETLYFYFAICIAALVLKYLSVLASKIINHGRSLDHEQQHDLGNYIKILILILLGLGIWYLANSGLNIKEASAVWAYYSVNFSKM